MIRDKLKTNLTTMRAENSWSRVALAASAIAIALLSYKVINPDIIVTLSPPGLDERANIMEDKADKPIHIAWSRYLAKSLGNVTPSTAKFLRETIDPLLAPEIRKEALVILDTQIDLIKRDEVSFSFEPRDAIYEPETGKTFITGRFYTHQLVGDPERTNRTYEFKWRYENFLPVLSHIQTYEGAPRVKK